MVSNISSECVHEALRVHTRVQDFSNDCLKEGSTGRILSAASIAVASEQTRRVSAKGTRALQDT